MAPVLAKPVTDLDIQEWVHEHYGFVPHPYWISHCRELFLHKAGTPRGTRKLWQECPVEKRSMIREAFLHFGLLAE